MGNVISTCLVVVKSNGYIEPTIYLGEPFPLLDGEQAILFDNPFTAKNFILERMGTAVEITVYSTAA